MSLSPERSSAVHHTEHSSSARTGELMFSLVAVTKFHVRGEPSVDVPDTPVESISLYNADEYGVDGAEPILTIEPGTGETTVAPSLPDGIQELVGKINTRWDVEHADMHSSEPAPDHSELTGNFGDRADWLVPKDT